MIYYLFCCKSEVYRSSLLVALELLIYSQISCKNIFPVKLCSLVAEMLILYVICYALLALLIEISNLKPKFDWDFY